MARTASVTLATTEPRPGTWCDECNLSSAYTVDILHLCDHGVDHVATIQICPDCQNWERLT